MRMPAVVCDSLTKSLRHHAQGISGSKENPRGLAGHLCVVFVCDGIGASMKGVLCACLLVWLQFMPAAQAYEADVHYSTTYVLARAVGWSEADALIIASANQAVDENQDTVAALEVEATSNSRVSGYVMSSFRQAEKNLRFHCFSKTREQGTRISADVHRVISGHFA